MLLDVPFLPDPDYLSLLKANASRLAVVHYPLGLPDVPDARHLDPESGDPAKALAALPGPKKHALVNSRFFRPSDYFDSAYLGRLAKVLEGLRASGVLDGLTFADPFFLRALSEYAPGLCAGLEAVPSVNMRLDGPGPLRAALEAVERTRFDPPSYLVLDRRLNRRPARLAETVAQARRLLPGARIGLLANEGCLDACPYKGTHNAVRAACRLGLGPEVGFDLVSRFGCLKDVAREPWRVLASPFIRPEDAGEWEGAADVLKVCARGRGGAVAREIVGAYLEGEYAGNLFFLLDSMEPLARSLRLDNHRLPGDFAYRTRECSHDCRECGWCRELARGLVSRLSPTLDSLDSRAP